MLDVPLTSDAEFLHEADSGSVSEVARVHLGVLPELESRAARRLPGAFTVLQVEGRAAPVPVTAAGLQTRTVRLRRVTASSCKFFINMRLRTFHLTMQTSGRPKTFHNCKLRRKGNLIVRRFIFLTKNNHSD